MQQQADRLSEQTCSVLALDACPQHQVVLFIHNSPCQVAQLVVPAAAEFGGLPGS